MSSTLHVTVDTEPMADSVSRVASHVDATMAAVVAMKVATVAAEKAAANHICNNVNRGFHTLLISQVSQKCAKAKSIVDAKLQELLHFEESLRRVKDQMERDFHRIAGRYLKIFKNLDNSLRARVFELDRAPADLATKQLPEAQRRMLNGGVQTPIHQSESLTASQTILFSVARKNTVKALMHMQGMLVKTATLQTSMSRIIDATPADSVVPVCIPAVLFESDGINLPVNNRTIHLPAPSSEIEGALQGAFSTLAWAPADAASNTIRLRVKKSLESAAIPERVRLKALELLEAVQWQQTQAGAV